MINLPRDRFEKTVVEALKMNAIPGMCSDEEFLRRLNQKLNRLPQPKPNIYQVWLNGIFIGVTAAAIGVIILLGLNILPPLFVKATITGTGVIQEKIVKVALQQRILWQHVAIALEIIK